MSSVLTICEKMSTRCPSVLSLGSSLSSSTYLPDACGSCIQHTACSGAYVVCAWCVRGAHPPFPTAHPHGHMAHPLLTAGGLLRTCRDDTLHSSGRSPVPRARRSLSAITGCRASTATTILTAATIITATTTITATTITATTTMTGYRASTARSTTWHLSASSAATRRRRCGGAPEPQPEPQPEPEP